MRHFGGAGNSPQGIDRLTSPVARFLDKGLKLYYFSCSTAGKNDYAKKAGQFFERFPKLRGLCSFGAGAMAVVGVAAVEAGSLGAVTLGGLAWSWGQIALTKAGLLAMRNAAPALPSPDADPQAPPQTARQKVAAAIGRRKEIQRARIGVPARTDIDDTAKRALLNQLEAQDRRCRLDETEGMWHKGILRSPTGRLAFYIGTAAGALMLLDATAVGAALKAGWSQKGFRSIGAADVPEAEFKSLVALGDARLRKLGEKLGLRKPPPSNPPPSPPTGPAS
jgi:hypothetical protein